MELSSSFIRRCRPAPEMGFPGVLSAGSGRATSRRDSGGQGGKIMIKSDAQRERTVAQIEGFRQALAKVGRGEAWQALCRDPRELREHDPATRR